MTYFDNNHGTSHSPPGLSLPILVTVSSYSEALYKLTETWLEQPAGQRVCAGDCRPCVCEARPP